MKALVLAGGSGTRLRPLTHTVSKQLVPIANKPVLFHGLEAVRDAGITEVGVIIGPHGADVRRAVGDGSRFGLHVTYIPQEAPLGLAHCVLIARDFLEDDDFVMYLGDNVISGGIEHLVREFWATRPDALVMVGKVPNPSEYGVAELDADGRVLQLEGKAEPANQRPGGDRSVRLLVSDPSGGAQYPPQLAQRAGDHRRDQLAGRARVRGPRSRVFRLLEGHWPDRRLVGRQPRAAGSHRSGQRRRSGRRERADRPGDRGRRSADHPLPGDRAGGDRMHGLDHRQHCRGVHLDRRGM
nr:sugar phosphate nucleotidyltransferase [Fodinicola feengrottensis]